MKALNSRLVAANIVTRVLQDGQSLTAALESAFQSIASSKDKSFIQALSFGVCRYFFRLDFILNQLLSKPIKDEQIKSLALVGLFQLCHMRIKPHAAVSETVLATGKKTWAKALINAILRTYLREQTSLDHKADLYPESVFSHSAWMIEKIQQDWPEQAERILIENNRQAPMTIRVNLVRTSQEYYLQQLADQGIASAPDRYCPSAIVLDQPIAVEMLPGFDDGLVSVQDAAAQLAAPLLNVLPGQRVLDVCAAPGGKAAHILETQPHLQKLVAVDIDAARLERVGINLRRLKLQAELVIGDAAAPKDWWDGTLFDRILVDVPCSALGVIRRHPDIKLLRRAEDIDRLICLQKNIIDAIWPLLAPGGLLLYATCSILKQENEQQISAFLKEHDDSAEIKIIAPWGLAGTHGRQILTGDAGMDGFYYALLGKR